MRASGAIGASSGLAPEARLLLLAAGPSSNDAALLALVRDGVDWGALTRLAIREQALSPLVRRLRRVTGGLPAEAAGLAQLALPFDFRVHHAARRLGDAMGALMAAGITPLLLKGAALAHGVYPSMHERPMGDVDLLVAPEEAPRAIAALAAAGWVRAPDAYDDSAYDEHHHLPPLDDIEGGGLPIELHTRLVPEGSPFALTPESVRARGHAVSIGAGMGLVPDSIDLLLHAAVHLAWSHALRSAAWRTARDVQALAASGSLDMPAVVARARETRTHRCLYWTLRLARVLAGVEGLGAVERALRPRLPEVVLARLESHFARVLLPGAAEPCPSAALERQLWCLGLLDWTGWRSGARPWDGDERFRASRRLPAATTGAPDGEVAPGGMLGAMRYGARLLRGS